MNSCTLNVLAIDDCKIREKFMIEPGTVEHLYATYDTLPIDEKVKVLKRLLGDLNLLLYFISFFDQEQIAEILRAIAEYLVRKT